MDVSSQDLYDARWDARLDLDQAAALTGLCPRTLRRQETGRAPVNLAVYNLFRLLAGELLDPAWSGWCVRRGLLWSPDDNGYRPGEILALPWLHTIAAAQSGYWRDKVNEKTGADNVVGLPVGVRDRW